jgi:phage protein D
VINPDIGGTSRQPRGIVKIGPWNAQVVMDGWSTVEVVNNNLSSADTFHVTLATSELPDGYDTNWFSTQKDMYVQVFMGFPEDPANFSASDLTQMIFGQVDSIDFDPGLHEIRLSGRDLTRVFIDTKSTQKYPNLTSSQIATQLAQAHGLTANVTPTSTPVGKFYEIDHVTMTEERSDWDLLLYLAGVEGYVVYVRGQTLYFNPRQAASTQDPYVIQWQQETSDVNTAVANVQSIQFCRALTVARGVQVVIRSWNHKQAKGFTSSYPGHKGKNIQVGQATPFGGAQVYTRTIPNLTQDQADLKAKELYAAIVAHEMKFSAELPGDVILDTTSVIQVTGTDTAYDQTYYPDVITRHLSFEGGFTMSVSAKNHAPDTAATL